MTTLNFLAKQHIYNLVSTVLLSVAALPLLSVSSYGYILVSTIILVRGLLLYGAAAYGITKNHEAYALQVVKNKSFRGTLAGFIIRTSLLPQKRNRNITTIRQLKTTASRKLKS